MRLCPKPDLGLLSFFAYIFLIYSPFPFYDFDLLYANDFQICTFSPSIFSEPQNMNPVDTGNVPHCQSNGRFGGGALVVKL